VLVDRYDSALGAQVYDLAISHGAIGGPDVDGVWLPLRMRYFFRFEMELLLEKRGFAVERVYGDWRRRAFRSGSAQIILVARLITARRMY
jgi:hypothetical protein